MIRMMDSRTETVRDLLDIVRDRLRNDGMPATGDRAVVAGMEFFKLHRGHETGTSMPTGWWAGKVFSSTRDNRDHRMMWLFGFKPDHTDERWMVGVDDAHVIHSIRREFMTVR